VVDGLARTRDVIALLEQRGIASTWGVVGGCCCASLDELRDRAPRAFPMVSGRLDAALRARPDSEWQILFCPEMVDAIAGSNVIEVGSHGFLHLVPNGVPAAVLRDDVAASVEVLRARTGKDVQSFIPPQNYHWPDEAFAGTGIEYVRHTPVVLGYPYSDPRSPAKFARLFNDFVRPVPHGGVAKLLFLRIDRGARLWNAQLQLIRRLIEAGDGAVYCFSHPHNLDSDEVLARFTELCDVLAQARDKGELRFRRFFRELRH
jgi:peptidoglycan/xylan/chitin deacetylase (PgdA/CDA1 family)